MRSNRPVVIACLPLALSAILAAGCVAPSGEPAASAASAVPSTEAARAPGQAVPQPAERPKFDNAEAAFARAKKDLMEGYYSDDVGEEELYRAALEGMLEHLDPSMKSWQKLLTPAELAE